MPIVQSVVRKCRLFRLPRPRIPKSARSAAEAPAVQQSGGSRRIGSAVLGILAAAVLLFVGSAVSAQELELETASDLLRRVSQEYGGFEDYTASIVMTTENGRMEGMFSHRKPSDMLIDFTDPEDQFILSDGEYLRIYVPRLNTTLTQRLQQQTDAAPAGFATEEGLSLLRRNYSVAFQSQPEFTNVNGSDAPGEAVGPDTDVVHLLFDTSRPRDGFRQLVLAIDEDYRIRRIVGTTEDYESVQIDFMDVEPNQGLSDSRFEYESPPDASTYEDFLFDAD